MICKRDMDDLLSAVLLIIVLVVLSAVSSKGCLVPLAHMQTQAPISIDSQQSNHGTGRQAEVLGSDGN